MAVTTNAGDNRGITDLLKDLRDETTTLLRQEVALAKTELTEKSGRLGRNLGYLATGGMVAYAGLLFLLLAATAALRVGLEKMGLSDDISVWLAPLIVGLVVAGIGYVLVQKAITTLKHESVVPEKTVASLQENKQWIQQKVT